MPDWIDNPTVVAALISAFVSTIGVIVSVVFGRRELALKYRELETQVNLKSQELETQVNLKSQELETQVLLKSRELEAQAELKVREAIESRGLEFDKSELVVWVELRKDILAEMWVAHREITKAMSMVILRMQEILQSGGFDPYRDPPITQSFKPVREKLQPTTEQYRRLIYDSTDLLAPEAIDRICQRFLEKSYRLFDIDARSQTDLRFEYEFALKVIQELKAIRYEFSRYTAKLYGLEKMMPWMVGETAK